MSTLERSALILGSDHERLETLAARLRRANLAVRSTLRASEAVQLVFETRLDLVVVVLPVPGSEKVLGAVRAEGSASLRAGVLVVGGGEGHEDSDLAHGRLANRLLPPTCSSEELDRAVATLLGVAPRIELRGSTRLRLQLASGMPAELEVANLSESGMLVASREPMPLGAVFGFALELPAEPEPVRGQGQVVRLERRHGTERGFGVRFLALGGEGGERLRALIERERANSNDAITVAGSPAPAGLPPFVSAASETARRREELAQLTFVLDDLLRRGLTRRLAVADWYLTGAELGLESLRAFSTILESVHEERTISAETSRRLADLVEVRRKLADFGRAQQDLASRVRILLGLRAALGRLLLEMGEGSTSGIAAARSPGVVAQVAVDIRRLVGAKRGLERLAALLDELRSPRYLFARGAVRKMAERIRRDHGGLAAALGLDLGAERLLTRLGLRRAIGDVERELRGARRRLATVHQKAFSLRFRQLATDDVDADLMDPKLQQVLVDTLAAGSDYLARAYGAYRHAIEAVGADPGLLERAARLASQLAAAERELPSDAAPARTVAPAPQPPLPGSAKSWSSEAGDGTDG
jgi:hypothetical protein